MAAYKVMRARNGQAALEYILVGGGIVFPLIFMIVFLSQLLWTWHSAVEWTRDGARYAATHCFQNNGENVRAYMRTRVPVHMDQQEFQSGTADIQINYYARNPETGQLEDFQCAGGDCSVECVPDVVSIRISGYQFRRFVGYMNLQPIEMPSFLTSVPMESAGCDPESGTCTP
jgi:hypothetical protein